MNLSKVKALYFTLSLVIYSSLCFISCNDKDNAEPEVIEPTIVSFSPNLGTEGTTVLISGTNFSTTPSNNIVLFNGIAATVTASTTTRLTATVPVGTTTGKITVTVTGLSATSQNDFKKVSDCLLMKYTTVRSGTSENSYVNTFTYDSKRNLITEVDGSLNRTTSYTYVDGLITKSEVEAETSTWTYNSDKLLDQIVTRIEFSTDSSITKFAYSDTRRLLNIVQIQSNIEPRKQTYTYEGDNVIQMAAIDLETESLLLDFKYADFDTNPNPFLLLAKAMGNQVFVPKPGIWGPEVSVNNAKQLILPNLPIVITYEYNDNGYPSKMVTDWGSGDIDTVTFEYSDCQ